MSLFITTLIPSVSKFYFSFWFNIVYQFSLFNNLCIFRILFRRI